MAVAAIIVITQYLGKQREEELQPADISVWFSVAEGSSEEEAMNMVVSDFIGEYPNVTIDLKAIPEAEYAEEIAKAHAEGALPDLFESSGLPESVLQDARDAKDILDTIQASDCLFLNQYTHYYKEYKQIPLGIEVPLAYVITNGASFVEYDKEFFSDPADFGDIGDQISVDDLHNAVIQANFPDLTAGKSKKDFMDNTENSSPVMLSTTMSLNEVRSTLTNYEKSFVYYDSSKIKCGFVYEWSLGAGSKNEEKAGERLLAWMLGNSYQSFLMITEANDGQIPLNEICFRSKIESKYLNSIESIYKKFVFER